MAAIGDVPNRCPFNLFGNLKKLEPALFATWLWGNIGQHPFSGAINTILPGIGEVNGIIDWLFDVGIQASEAMPLLLFIGIGAMIDFGPLLSNPRLILFGAAAQFGIFATISVATLMGFPLKDAASIGIIGAADGPRQFWSLKFSERLYGGDSSGCLLLHGPSAHNSTLCYQVSYHQGAPNKDATAPRVSLGWRLLFPIVVTLLAGYGPSFGQQLGLLMFGNLIRESLVLGASLRRPKMP